MVMLRANPASVVSYAPLDLDIRRSDASFSRVQEGLKKTKTGAPARLRRSSSLTKLVVALS